MTRRCDQCELYHALSPLYGECRANAPRPVFQPDAPDIPADLVQAAYWPHVSADMWCGEFEPRAADVEARARKRLAKLRAQQGGGVPIVPVSFLWETPEADHLEDANYTEPKQPSSTRDAD